jgi:hypothetical protein
MGKEFVADSLEQRRRRVVPSAVSFGVLEALPTAMTESFCCAGCLLGLGDRPMANPTLSRYNRPVMTNNPT